jgi:hypothetical protein
MNKHRRECRVKNERTYNKINDNVNIVLSLDLSLLDRSIHNGK